MLLLMLSILLLLGRRRSKTNTRAPSQVQYKSPLWKIKSWIFAPRVPTLPSRTGRRPDQYYHHPSISPRRVGRWRYKCRCRSRRLLWRRGHDPGRSMDTLRPWGCRGVWGSENVFRGRGTSPWVVYTSKEVEAVAPLSGPWGGGAN